MNTALRILLLAAAGSALGVTASAVNPAGVGFWRPVRPTAAADQASCVEPPATLLVKTAEALEWHRAGLATFVDLRRADQYAQGHIEGAFHMPCRSATTPDVDLPRGQTIVLYGDVQNAEWAAEALRRRGHKDVRMLAEDFAAWRKMQGPAEAGSCDRCTDHP